MNAGPGNPPDPEVMVEMNMTPLIDVMLVMIIMLIITIPIQNHSINLHLPVGKPPPSAPPPVINLDIDLDGSLYWNGAPIPDRATLEQKLRDIAATADQPELHLRPNKLVAYKHVAAVMAAAQRLGVTKIGMFGNEQYGK